MRPRIPAILSCLLLTAAPAAAQVVDTYLAEDFSVVPPAGWTLQDNGSSAVWDDGSFFARRNPIIEEMAFHTYQGGAFCDSWMISPPLDLRGITGPLYLHWFDLKQRLDYQAHHSNSLGGGISTLEISTDGGNQWTTVWTETREDDESTSVHVDLSAYAGQAPFQFAFRYQGQNGHEWGIDEVRLDNTPFGLVRKMRNPANGHLYWQSYAGTWYDALAAGIALGGDIVSLSDDAEHDWVWENFSNWSSINSNADEFIDRSLWTSGTDAFASEGLFVWLSGEEWGYTNWSAGQPDNDDEFDPQGEDFITLDLRGQWFDDRPDLLRFIVIEIPGPVLEFTPLRAGHSTTLSLSNVTAGGSAIFAYSLSGPGPTQTQYGEAQLTPPIESLGPVQASAQGVANLELQVPISAAGLTVFLQGLDLAAGTLSNPRTSTVL